MFDTSRCARAEAAGRIELPPTWSAARARGMDVTAYELELRDAVTALTLADPQHALRVARTVGGRLELILTGPR